MSKRFVQAIKANEVAPGGMKPIEIEERELVICNSAGCFYAIDRRCGHMNAPLDRGTLDGVILTCPMHCAQFDVTTGEALSGPIPRDFGREIPPPRMLQFLQNVAMLMNHIRTHSIRTYETKVEAGMVWVGLE